MCLEKCLASFDNHTHKNEPNFPSHPLNHSYTVIMVIQFPSTGYLQMCKYGTSEFQHMYQYIPCLLSRSSIFTRTSALIFANRVLASWRHRNTSLKIIRHTKPSVYQYTNTPAKFGKTSQNTYTGM